MARELYYAGRGLGAWHQIAGRPAERIAVSDRRRRGAWASMANPACWSEELLAAMHREVMLISNMKGSCGVASGVIDAQVCAGSHGLLGRRPLAVLLTEAGGRVTDLDGNDVRSGTGTVLASNGHLHDALLELIRGVPTARDYEALARGEPAPGP
jgi:histidinol-phosphatase